jgi:hypothetical protein
MPKATSRMVWQPFAVSAIHDRIRALLGQLSADLDAIALTDPGSLARGRAITNYSRTYAMVGRLNAWLTHEGDRFVA